jgi:hypothetical protein
MEFLNLKQKFHNVISVLLDFTSLYQTLLPGPRLRPNWTLRQPAHVLLAAATARLLQNMQRQVFDEQLISCAETDDMLHH